MPYLQTRLNVSPKRLLVAAVFCTFCMVNSSLLAGQAFPVTADKVDYVNAPVTIELKVPDQISAKEAQMYARAGAVLSPGGNYVQIEPITKDGNVVAAKLRWVEKSLKKGQTKVYKIENAPQTFAPIDAFQFKMVDDGLHRELSYGARHTGIRPVWRHAFLKYNAEDHFTTYKHFHHLYSWDGKSLVTNGPGSIEDYKKARYPHHRGMYMGWSKTRVNGQSYDTWHCSKGVSLQHQKYLTDQEFVGPVVARSVSLAHWTGGDKKVIVNEQRTLATWHVGRGKYVLDFEFKLTPGKDADGDIELNGDPQHAGFQFRAHNDVTKSLAKYIRQATASGGKGDVWKTCHWIANQFKVNDVPYTVVHMDHKDNPGTADNRTVYSTRNYGRFGAYAPHTLKKDGELVFNYRVTVIDPTKHSDASVEHFEGAYQQWLNPPSTKIGS